MVRHLEVGERWIRPVFLVVVACIGLAYAWTSLSAIANFAFRYPVFDQFRLYRIYLGTPFPQSAIQLENGHRPILPALVRLAEMRWMAADQYLQIVVGTCAAALAVALVLVTIFRTRNVPGITKGAAALLTVIAVFWLGNARMLMHGNESVHAYFVVLFTLCAVLAVCAARGSHQTLWVIVAALSCLAATFSFGTGMASFGAALLTGFIIRLRRRNMAVIVVCLLGALAVYLAGLPGDEGVRGTLMFDPAANLGVLMRWLSAPWMRAWLGHGDPSLEPWLQSSLLARPIGSVLVMTARWLDAPFAANAAMQVGAIIGGIGIGAYLLILLHAWRSREQAGAARMLALGLSTFGLGAAVIVCFARLHYFKDIPGQVFADRYLPWSCLFWLGLALYPVLGEHARPAWRAYGFACLVVLCAAIFAPSHRALAGWSATVYRHVQQSAVAAQLGIWDPARFEDPSATIEDVEATLAGLKQRRLSMFAEPAFALIEGGWRLADLPPLLDGAGTRVVREFDDPHSARQIVDFEGWMPRIPDRAKDPVLVVVDTDGFVRGLAKLSYIAPGAKSLRFNIAHKRGFDGYVLDARPGESLWLVMLDAQSRPMGRIVLEIPPRHMPAK